MDRSFHYQLMIVHALFHSRVMSMLADTGLSPGQPKILDYLSKHDGSMQKEIAFACQIDPATVTGILTRMEEKGLVERRMQNGNRRAFFVYLTDMGREKCQLIKRTFSELEQAVFAGIPENERTQFLDTFCKICSNMTDTEGLQ